MIKLLPCGCGYSESPLWASATNLFDFLFVAVELIGLIVLDDPSAKNLILGIFGCQKKNPVLYLLKRICINHVEPCVLDVGLTNSDRIEQYDKC